MQIDISAHINGYIDPTEINNHKQLSETELGGRCEALLNPVVLGDKEQLFHRSTKFSRWALRTNTETVHVFERQRSCAAVFYIALSTTTNRPRSIVRLALQFPLLVSEADLDRLQEQWRELPRMKETLGDMIKLPLSVLLVADSFHKRWDRSTEIWSSVKVHVCIVGLATIISLRRTSLFTSQHDQNKNDK